MPGRSLARAILMLACQSWPHHAERVQNTYDTIITRVAFHKPMGNRTVDLNTIFGGSGVCTVAIEVAGQVRFALTSEARARRSWSPFQLSARPSPRLSCSPGFP